LVADVDVRRHGDVVTVISDVIRQDDHAGRHGDGDTDVISDDDDDDDDDVDDRWLKSLRQVRKLLPKGLFRSQVNHRGMGVAHRHESLTPTLKTGPNPNTDPDPNPNPNPTTSVCYIQASIAPSRLISSHLISSGLTSLHP